MLCLLRNNATNKALLLCMCSSVLQQKATRVAAVDLLRVALFLLEELPRVRSKVLVNSILLIVYESRGKQSMD